MIVKVEGLADLDRALSELPKTIARGVLRRTLQQAAKPTADRAAQMAPKGETGRLIGSIVVATQLTRRHRRGAKVNEVEVHIGPKSGGRVLNYASFVEFGTIDTPAQPYLRPAWDSTQGQVLASIKTTLGTEIEKAAARISRKAARLAAKG